MKKLFVTIAVLMSTIISSNANEIKMIDTIDRINSELISKNDSALAYNLNVNKNIDAIQKSFNLDNEQKQIIFDIQRGVADSFFTLNSMTDKDAREHYFENIIEYWKHGAFNSFYATGKTDAMKDFRRYWTCAAMTLKNQGYIDERGNFINK